VKRLYTNLSALASSADSSICMAVREQKCVEILRNVLYGTSNEESDEHVAK